MGKPTLLLVFLELSVVIMPFKLAVISAMDLTQSNLPTMKSNYGLKMKNLLNTTLFPATGYTRTSHQLLKILKSKLGTTGFEWSDIRSFNNQVTGSIYHACDVI